MLAEERRNQILEILNDVELCPVSSLVERLDVARVTVVRDLAALEKAGVVTRVHGGAKLRKNELMQYEARFKVRMNKNLPLKEAIAAEAACFVRDDSTIFIDSSTTGYIFARELMKRQFAHLNIITNSPSILNAAREKTSPTVIITGGELNTTFNMLGGLWVIDFLEKINIDLAFISASGISEKLNLTTSSIDLASILNKVIDKSNQANLLVDSTKLCKQEMINICPLSRCARMITDAGIPPERAAHIRSAVELVIARPL